MTGLSEADWEQASTGPLSRPSSATRDALLPQLMSGTLRVKGVKGVEKVLEGVL
jgi:hypothetical protein